MRFTIHWSPQAQRWLVLDEETMTVAKSFPTLHEAEAYCIERNTRVET